MNYKKKSESNKEGIVFGKQPVLELIEGSSVTVNKIWISDSFKDRTAKDKILSFAKEKKVPYSIVPNAKINSITEHGNNQGIALSIAPITYYEVNELIKELKGLDDSRIIGNTVLIANEIQDPHNLGAMIRTFIGAGGKYIFLTGRSSVGINSTVMKTSAGTLFKSKIARATNCNQLLEKLKDNEFWIVGTDSSEDSKDLYSIDFPTKIAVLMGNEGDGLSSLIKKNCDFLARIPLSNEVESLNVSVAFGITLYEIIRQNKN